MKKHHLLLLTAAVLTPCGLHADPAKKLPVSRTAGILRVSLPPNQISLVSLPMVDRVVDCGSVTGTPTATIALSTTTLGDVTTNPHSIQIVSGNAYGTRLRITAATASSVSVAAPVAGLTAGDQYIIVPDDTLASIFGATNSAGLLGAAGAAGADEVYIQLNGTLTGFFYKSTGLGGTGWRRIANPSGASEPNAPIDPLTGVYVLRKAGGSPVNLDITGLAVTGRQKPTVTAGFNVLSNPFTLPTTLGKSGLKDFINGGTGPATADIIYIESGGTFTGYFFKNGGLGGTGWRLIDNPSGSNQDSIVLTPGKGILFQEQAGTAAFTMQEPFTE